MGSGEDEALVPEVAQPELEARSLTATCDEEGDWLCALCLQAVANERDRFSYNGQDEFNFANPDGFRFEIITFSETRGCRQSGIPTLDYTWFAGHAWSFCQCAECGQHLGWYYSGQHQFAGLIKERLVRALWVRT